MAEAARILIVEDDPDAAEVMKVTLEARGYRVDTAPDPDQGLRQAREARPDVIVLDVMFGRKEEASGLEYAVKVRQDRGLASIPILMVTAVNVKRPGFDFSPDTDAEYLPVDEFIDKPAQPKDLVAKVEKLLAMKESRWKDWPKQTD